MPKPQLDSRPSNSHNKFQLTVSFRIFFANETYVSSTPVLVVSNAMLEFPVVISALHDVYSPPSRPKRHDLTASSKTSPNTNPLGLD